MIFTALIVLLGIHFMYHIEYNPLVREVMELFQEKLFAISLSQGKLALLIPTCIAHLAVWRINSVAAMMIWLMKVMQLKHSVSCELAELFSSVISHDVYDSNIEYINWTFILLYQTYRVYAFFVFCFLFFWYHLFWKLPSKLVRLTFRSVPVCEASQCMLVLKLRSDCMLANRSHT